jgi:hypothetical protein
VEEVLERLVRAGLVPVVKRRPPGRPRSLNAIALVTGPTNRRAWLLSHTSGLFPAVIPVAGCFFRACGDGCFSAVGGLVREAGKMGQASSTGRAELRSTWSSTGPSSDLARTV